MDADNVGHGILPSIVFLGFSLDYMDCGWYIIIGDENMIYNLLRW